MRLTVVVGPDSRHAAEHRVEAGPEGVLIGSASDAHVVVPGAAPHQARVLIRDAQVRLVALAPGVTVRDGLVRALAPAVPDASLLGRTLDVHQPRPLLRDDVVRLARPGGGPPRELRVDVGLVALGARRALLRGLPLALVASLVLSGVAARRGTLALASLALFGLLVNLTVAGATLVELWVVRAGAGWRRRLAAAAATAALVTLGLTGAVVNLRHADAVVAQGLSAAGAGAAPALAGCGAQAVAQRLLALGLTAALVLDARWWRAPAAAPELMALLGGPIAWWLSLVTVSAAGLPREAGDVVWAGDLHEVGYTAVSLVMALLFAVGLQRVQRRWPIG